MLENSHIIRDAPSLPGLTFRHFRGEQDYPAMVAVVENSKDEDQLTITTSVESVARSYSHLHNCDPFTDMLVVEMNHDVIGYSRVWWEEREQLRAYIHFAYLLPEWRGKGIRRCMVQYSEKRAQRIDAANPTDKSRFFQSWANDTEVHWKSLLLSEQYTPVRYNFVMVRSLEEDIPDVPLPEGLEIRPVNPEQYWTIWRASGEALQDLSEGSPVTDAYLEKWMESPTFTPDLWVVAWDTHTDEVAGSILNFINREENKKYQRKRGYTEFVTVRRPYRMKGLAKALIARSFHVLKGEGMTEATLTVDTENPSGALHVYETMGFSTVNQWAVYRKQLE